MRERRAAVAVWVAAAVAASGGAPAAELTTRAQVAAPAHIPHTLAEALGAAYENNPQITAERAHLRATDENVPAALAGWRPIVTFAGSAGWAVGRFDQPAACTNFIQTQTGINQYAPLPGTPGSCFTNGVFSPKTNTYTDSIQNNRSVSSTQGTVTQYLYRAGRTTASTHQAVNNVYAERARLIAQEEQTFTDTVNAYVTVVGDRQILAIDRANEDVLRKELQATNDRFRVGELTRTDVAQAEAALAQAIATTETAQGNLQTANATFVRTVGVPPPDDLADPQPLRLPVRSEKQASDAAAQNNPQVIAALFNQAQLKDAVDVAFSQLGPQLSVQGTVFYNNGQTLNREATYGEQATFNLSLPIYQGGAEYAAVRQARQNYQQGVRQTEDARRAAIEQAVQAWDTLVAAQAAIASSKVAIQANEIAVEGVEREAIVGSRTTQDVLIAQQNLLTAQLTLTQSVVNLVTASYGIASAIGRLTARDLGLQVPLYDETAYYNAVRDRLWGTGDRAVNQPGR